MNEWNEMNYNIFHFFITIRLKNTLKSSQVTESPILWVFFRLFCLIRLFAFLMQPGLSFV